MTPNLQVEVHQDIKTAAKMMAALEAWAGDPLSGLTSPVSIHSEGSAKTAIEIRASHEARTEDSPSALTPKSLSASAVAWDGDPLVREAKAYTASVEAWTGDPNLAMMYMEHKKMRNTASTAAEMMASPEAWIGDPPLARTFIEFVAIVVAWDDDPRVWTATDFAASLEAWHGYPVISELVIKRIRKEKKGPARPPGCVSKGLPRLCQGGSVCSHEVLSLVASPREPRTNFSLPHRGEYIYPYRCF